MVASMQFFGMVAFSIKSMMWLVSLMYESIFLTCGCRSTSCEMFSVGPPQPLTIGLTAMGFLCIFFKKYSCCVRGICSCLKCR